MKMVMLELTHAEMEGLRSICSVVDLAKVQERSMPGIASVMAKIYEFEEHHPGYRMKGPSNG